MRLLVRGPDRNLHSGNFGGVVHNLLQVLCEIIGQLRDANGRLAIPGFHDRVRRWSEEERAYMARAGPPDAQFCATRRQCRAGTSARRLPLPKPREDSGRRIIE
jgi:hypothetical protein